MKYSSKTDQDAINNTALVIRARLEAGIVPWRICWNRTGGFPRNYITGRPYRGVNLFLLAGAGFSSPWWISHSQAQRAGGFVREGEQPTSLYYWSFQKPKTPKAWAFHVFNLEQTFGLDAEPGDVSGHVFRRQIRLENILANMPAPPKIIPGRDFNAGYWPENDIIAMPLPQFFPQTTRHFHGLFCQLIHATGHPKRLNRYTRRFFDPDPFYLEGLCAEMGASILCGETGVQIPALAEELKGRGAWGLALQGNPAWFSTAAHQAQHAVDYTLGRSSKRSALTQEPRPRATSAEEPDTADLAATG